VRAPDVWTVGYVIDGSPAARAGLAVGDRVDLVEGLPVGQMPRPVYETLVQGRGGIRFRVLTDGAPRDVVVAPVTFVE
jgi:C-terminal processing protease CtpA/Prc